MATYSLAYAKDNLSRLVDEAVSGKPVVITRHGKAIVELKPLADRDRREAMLKLLDEIGERRRRRPPLGEDSVAVIRAMRDRDE